MAYDVLAGDAKTLADRLNGTKLLGPFPAQGLPLGALTLIFSDPAATVTFDGSSGALVTAVAAAADIQASFSSAVLELRRDNAQLYIAIWYGDGYTIDKDGTANALLGLSTTEDTVSEGAVDVTRIRGFSQAATGGHYSLILSTEPGSADPGIGDVDGPATSTNTAVARFSGTTGKIIQNSAVTIDNSGNIAVPALATVDGRDLSVDGAQLDANTAALATKANKRLTGNEQTGATYSIVQADEDAGVIGNRATAQTFTVDQLAAGTVIPVMQAGAGQITLTQGSGVTLRPGNDYKIEGQYKTGVLWWRTATEVWLSGQVVS